MLLLLFLQGIVASGWKELALLRYICQTITFMNPKGRVIIEIIMGRVLRVGLEKTNISDGGWSVFVKSFCFCVCVFSRGVYPGKGRGD